MSAIDFSLLTPDSVLNALESIGLRSDGRMLALNSYENRVYQIGMEEGPPVVAKFYRPLRWTDDAILEEHAFVHELVEREIPVVPALALDGGKTLHSFDGYRFAVFAKHGGRAPELENRDTLEWMGRFLGRIHAVGALAPYTLRPALNLDTFGIAPRAEGVGKAVVEAGIVVDRHVRIAIEPGVHGRLRLRRQVRLKKLRLAGLGLARPGCRRARFQRLLLPTI